VLQLFWTIGNYSEQITGTNLGQKSGGGDNFLAIKIQYKNILYSEFKMLYVILGIGVQYVINK